MLITKSKIFNISVPLVDRKAEQSDPLGTNPFSGHKTTIKLRKREVFLRNERYFLKKIGAQLLRRIIKILLLHHD